MSCPTPLSQKKTRPSVPPATCPRSFTNQESAHVPLGGARSSIRPSFHRKACQSPVAVRLAPTTQPPLLIASAQLSSPPRLPRSLTTPASHSTARYLRTK